MISTIGDYAFDQCSSLAIVSVEANSHLEAIGSNSFRGTNLISIAIPTSLTNISENAFSGINGSG